MKRLFSILLLCAIAQLSFGQSTTPRFSSYGTTDASSISYGRAVLADVASATLDTIKCYPRHQQVIVECTVTDSCTLQMPTTGGCFKNDRLYLYITNSAQTGVFNLLGNFVVSTGTKKLSLTANKHCVLVFWFDGTSFIEISRNLNY